MRIIKFRIWNGKDSYCTEDFVKANLFNMVDSHPEYVQQFTGLLDKFGKEIYEGDIIKANLPYGKLFVVNWVNTRGAFMLAGATEQDFAAYDREGYKLNAGKKEIVGNIYENYNLIK